MAGAGKLRVACVSVVPSPYQRDLFAALARRDDVELHVFYMEKAAPDSPWPEKPLGPHERYLRGFWFPVAHARVHCNWGLPDPRHYDAVICNTLMSLTGQWLMRVRWAQARWFFWGEKLGPRSARHDQLTQPLHRAAGIAAIGTWAERDYAARFPRTRVFNIPYHCDVESFRSTRRETRPGVVTFLFCGQMIARKGLDDLLTAFARLPTQARLLLVGREADLPAMLAGLPAEVRVRIEYAGFQAPEALPEFFARADVFVLPSRYDGWGVVVNQALGAGLPIVCSDQVGAGWDLVREGENGFRFSAGDRNALAEKLGHFCGDSALVSKMGERSRAAAAEWTPDRGAERWVTAMREVLA